MSNSYSHPGKAGGLPFSIKPQKIKERQGEKTIILITHKESSKQPPPKGGGFCSG
jgi:hypothetical protein